MGEGALFDPTASVAAVEAAAPAIVPFLVTFLLLALVIGVAWFLIDSMRNR